MGVDSGAGASVLPSTVCVHLPLEKLEDDAKRSYRTAIGEDVPDEGQRVLIGQPYGSTAGRSTAIKFRVANVCKPVASVAELVDSGHQVVFEKRPDGEDSARADRPHDEIRQARHDLRVGLGVGRTCRGGRWPCGAAGSIVGCHGWRRGATWASR